MTVPQIYLKLNTGALMPALGFGGAVIKPEDINPDIPSHVKYIEEALEAGYRHIDTARIYGTEELIGEAINNKIKAGLIKREDVFITTKIWCNSPRREEVVPTLRKSLENLKMEYVDLFLIHWPTAFKPSEDIWPSQIEYGDTDYIETWQGMQDCYQLGLTKAIGVSNFNSKQISRILNTCEVKPVNNQVESHPFFTNQKLIDFCNKNEIIVTAYSPLCGLPWKFNPSPDRPSIFTDPTIKSVAANNKRTPAQVTLRYHLHRGIAVIPKTTNRDRMKENLQALNFELSDEDIRLIGSCNIDYKVCTLFQDHPHYPFNEEF